MNPKVRLVVVLLVCCVMLMASQDPGQQKQQFGAVVNTIALAGTMWAMGGLVGCIPCVIGGGILAVGAGAMRYFLL